MAARVKLERHGIQWCFECKRVDRNLLPRATTPLLTCTQQAVGTVPKLSCLSTTLKTMARRCYFVNSAILRLVHTIIINYSSLDLFRIREEEAEEEG